MIFHCVLKSISWFLISIFCLFFFWPFVLPLFFNCLFLSSMFLLGCCFMYWCVGSIVTWPRCKPFVSYMNCLTFKCCAFSWIYILNFPLMVNALNPNQNSKTQSGTWKLLLELRERVACLMYSRTFSKKVEANNWGSC